MSAAPQERPTAPDLPTDVPTDPPRRFRSAEARGRRLGRVLRLAAGVREVDEELMARIGAGLWQVDEVGARLAEAIRLPAGSPGRVPMAAFRTALAEGIGAVEDPPPALADFFAEVEATPDWVDPELLERGRRAYLRLGQNAGDVLLQLSLIGGYRFGGPPDLLVATGGLTGDSTRRRLAETQHWTTAISRPGGLQRDADGTWGEAWRLTVHVRAMHALVNAGFAERWDTARWGLPINQADQAGTLGLFDGVVLLGARALGVPVGREDARAVMHLWRYVGWLLGVDEQWLVESERERHRLNYHVLLAQGGVTPAGARLSRDIITMLGDLPHGRWKQERTLSMLTTFLGRESMRDLGLPRRPPWAHAYLLVLNTWRYRVGRRLPGGERRLDAWADRVVERTMRDFFGAEAPGVRRL
ncbi:oxygenase MpaB family protein [Nocardioides zeae]|uniref:Oxygenase MpaB family protein n=1 Tax=Nocardioides imazamoxiresistens TaxID=3231893 RepID=A0ABU3PUJ0_9ACTN|nr:oxygenase MpaB family protein [Nocardioides zeae]MDT9592891.1 oxygenase MpaB family protein [Nocardioides zeae]